jgi:hypothetical protein
MCLVVYIASRSPLPPLDAPAFNVNSLAPHEELVRAHFSLPFVASAGSYTGCGCGFNYGRCYVEEDSQECAQALESSAMLARFVGEYQVEQIYSCWSGDEAKPQAFARQLAPEMLMTANFSFRERELLTIDHTTS